MLSEAVDGVLSVTMAAQYSFDAGVVSVLLIISIVSALVLAVGLAVHQIIVAVHASPPLSHKRPPLSHKPRQAAARTHPNETSQSRRLSVAFRHAIR